MAMGVTVQEVGALVLLAVASVFRQSGSTTGLLPSAAVLPQLQHRARACAQTPQTEAAQRAQTSGRSLPAGPPSGEPPSAASRQLGGTL